MTAKLRGHHLICLNFFRGQGYSEDYIRNVHSIIGKENIEIVKCADDVCALCQYLINDRCINPENPDEMIQHLDTEALKLLGLKPGMMVDWKMISDKLPDIIGEWKSHFCAVCSYRKVCFG
jgi:hypothetical protein